MVQYIKQADIFGRIGSGIGQGLAEQLPKEIERGRLAQGLQQLNKQQNLTPQEYFTQALSIPGLIDRPQVVQSLENLSRQQGIRNSFINQMREQGGIPSSASPARQAFNDIKFANLSPDQIQRQVIQGDQIPSGFQTRGEQAAAAPGIVKEKGTEEKFKIPPPWTPAERDADIARESMMHPEMTFDQIVQRVNDNERRYLESPEAYRAELKRLKDLEKEAIKELDDQLQTSFQKEGKEIFKDISGPLLLDLRKAMLNDLETSNLNVKQAAEKWRRIGEDYVNTNNLIKEKSNRDLWDRLAPNKKENTLKSLMAAQPLYDKLDKRKEFYNLLRSNNVPPTYTTDSKGNRILVDQGSWGFGASPGRAAMIAYPRSEGIKNLIKEQTKFPRVRGVFNRYQFDDQKRSRKFAEDFAKTRTYKDSILAAAREMKDRDPYFNETAFFDWLRENQSKYNFNPDQTQEIINGPSDIFPNWGDLTLFPYSGRSAAHD